MASSSSTSDLDARLRTRTRSRSPKGGILQPASSPPVSPGLGAHVSFAPLPPAERDTRRRRSSIAVGVAARGQLLASAKAGSASGQVQYLPLTDEQWETYQAQHRSARTGSTEELPHPGTLLMQGGRALVSKIRKARSSSTSSSSSSSSSITSSQQAAAFVPPSPSIPEHALADDDDDESASSTSRAAASHPGSTRSIPITAGRPRSPPPLPPSSFDSTSSLASSSLSGPSETDSISSSASGDDLFPRTASQAIPSDEDAVGRDERALLEQERNRSSPLNAWEPDQAAAPWLADYRLQHSESGHATPRRRESFGGVGSKPGGGEGSKTPVDRDSMVLGFSKLNLKHIEDVRNWEREGGQ